MKNRLQEAIYKREDAAFMRHLQKLIKKNDEKRERKEKTA